MRPPTPIGLAAAAAFLPAGRESRAVPVGRGEIDRKLADELGYTAVTVSIDLAAPEMALTAARTAFTSADYDPRSLSLIAHSWMYHQGHDVWSAPHYLANALAAASSLPVGIQQVCNGAAVAIELAATWLAATSDPGPVLVTTGDRFAAPQFPRWSADYSLAYGDSGAAAVLGPLRPGHDLAEVTGIVNLAAAELEVMHRGDRPFGPAPLTPGGRVDIRGAKRAYLRDYGRDGFSKATRVKLADLLTVALADADAAGAGAPAWVALPRLGSDVLDAVYAPLVREICGDVDLVVPGRDTGHLGPGDLLVTAAELAPTLGPGRTGLILNAGAGFSFGALVLTGLREATS